jgi:hypothetical protein
MIKNAKFMGKLVNNRAISSKKSRYIIEDPINNKSKTIT